MKKTPKKRLKLVVLCGGPSSEWKVSMSSAKEIARHLPREKYDVSLVQITRDGRWMLVGRKEARPLSVFGGDGRTDKSDLKKFDLAFIAMHGQFGEDGRVQAILETIGLPYTFSGVLPSALGMNKLKTQELLSSHGIPVPKTMIFSPAAMSDPVDLEISVRRNIGYPCVVKPNESGSSVGVSVVANAAALLPAFEAAFGEDRLALVQEYIKGRELTCGVLGNAGEDLLPMPPVEIISHARFFDYEAKYHSKATEEICPAPISRVLTEKMQAYAAQAHDILGCDGLSRSDFILARNKFYFLETNTIPGMTAASLCPKEARAMGLSFGEFLDRIIELALAKQA